MNKPPLAILQTTMTRGEYLEVLQQQPKQPDLQEQGPQVHYEFSIETTERKFRRLMEWLDVHGIHGTLRASKQLEESNEIETEVGDAGESA